MSLVTPDFGLLVWMTLIFGIVFFILAKFGFPMITGSVEQRAERIKNALEQSKEAEQRMKNLAREQDELVSRARDERNEILKEAARTRQQIIAQARSEAQAEADSILSKAKQDIDHERESALRDVRRQIADLSMSIAEKVVRRSMEGDKAQSDYIDAMLDEMSSSEGPHVRENE